MDLYPLDRKFGEYANHTPGSLGPWHAQGDPPYSNGHFQYGGFRIERRDVGPGHLSAYYTRYDLDNSHFLFASGPERRNIFDVHYAGDYGGWDWDLE